MHRNHITFHVGAYLLAFSGREAILETYLDGLPEEHLTIHRPIASAETLRDHLGICSPEESRTIIFGMTEAFELCTDEGHERMVQACDVAGLTRADLRTMPRECLALLLLAEHRTVFESAVSLDQAMSSDSLELFKPQGPVSLVRNLASRVGHFRSAVARTCGDKYGSRRILLNHFDSNETFMVGFFFEKLPKAQRLLNGDTTSPSLTHQEFRPIQLDFVSFEKATGILSIKSGWGRLTDQLRVAFAGSFLNSPMAYEWDGARSILDLSHVVDPNHELVGDDGRNGIVTDLEYHFGADQMDARYRVSGPDIREVLRRDAQEQRVQYADIEKVVVQMPVRGTSRLRRVVLKYPNRVEFRRTAGTQEIVRQLREWHVFTAPIPSDLAA